MCYLDARKLQDQQLLNVKEMAKIVKEAGAESQIFSHYTSPLYLANLTLCINEEQNLITNKLKDRLCFQVLEVEEDENLDRLNLDIEASNRLDKDDGFDML